MTNNSKTIFVFLFFLTTNLLGQDYDLLAKNEWMSTSLGFQKHYLFTFNDGRIKSEFSQSDWSRYILDTEHIFVFNNDHVIYRKEFDQISKEIGIQNATKPDTAIFKIKRLDNDSIILEPKNVRARELSYYYNRRTFRLDSNSFKTNTEIKLYNRQLSYQEVQIDCLVLDYFDNVKVAIDSKGNYTIKKIHKKNKNKPKIEQLTLKQYDQLLELIYKSNINYFKSPDKFEWRIRDWKGLKLKLIDKGEYINISTDDTEVPWTIKPLVDFMVELSKD